MLGEVCTEGLGPIHGGTGGGGGLGSCSVRGCER